MHAANWEARIERAVNNKATSKEAARTILAEDSHKPNQTKYSKFQSKIIEHSKEEERNYWKKTTSRHWD